MKKFTEVEIIEDIVEVLENGYTGYYKYLHNETFNTDYYINGYNEAEETLINSDYGIFGALEIIKEHYSEMGLGEFEGYDNPKSVANELYYILSEKFINDNRDIFEYQCEVATDEENARIILKLKELL